jgi:peptide/nickel transport system permease protein
MAIVETTQTILSRELGSSTASLRWHRLTRDRLVLASLVFILAVVAVSVAAPWIAPYDPNVADAALRLAPVGTPDHVLGVDAQGRDILSRVIWGGRSSLLVSVLPVAAAVLLSIALGLAAGYKGGKLAAFIMRVIDLAFAFPMVLLAIGLATAFGPGLWTVGLTIIFSATPYLTRVVYAEVRAERDKEYVEAAQALGASQFEIVFREILPNVATSVLVYGTTKVGGMIVFSAGLSFLGLGAQPPTAEWGRMVSEGSKVLILGSAHVATVPALVIVAVALAFNWLGDGLRDLLDPRR